MAVVDGDTAIEFGRVGFRVHSRVAMPRNDLGGSVSFHSAETTGTTFVVELPV